MIVIDASIWVSVLFTSDDFHTRSFSWALPELCRYHEYYTTYSKDNSLDDKVLKKRMNAIAAAENFAVNGADKALINTELKLTAHFILYILNNYKEGEIKRKEMERFVPFKKQDALYLADSLLAKNIRTTNIMAM